MHEVRVVAVGRTLELRPLGVDVDQADGVAGLEPMLGLLDVATSMVRVVLFRPPEGVGALGVGLAELAAAALRHTLDAQGDGAIAVHIVHSPEAELLGWAAAQLDGCRAREGHEVGPADVTKLELHLGQEAPGLVQVGVVTPLVLRPVPLPRTLATPSSVRVVDQPEASRAVPGQAGEEPGVAGHVAVLRAVGWPVGPGRCHQRRNLPIEPRNVQRLQLAMVLGLAHDLQTPNRCSFFKSAGGGGGYSMETPITGLPFKL